MPCSRRCSGRRRYRHNEPRGFSVLLFTTCHPARLTRRPLLAGGGAFVAASALGARDARAGDDGTAVIRQWATLPEDPWAVCHGVRAMGREFMIAGGRRAADWLLETHLASVVKKNEVELHRLVGPAWRGKRRRVVRRRDPSCGASPSRAGAVDEATSL